MPSDLTLEERARQIGEAVHGGFPAEDVEESALWHLRAVQAETEERCTQRVADHVCEEHHGYCPCCTGALAAIREGK